MTDRTSSRCAPASSLPARLRAAGVAVLLCGIVAAALIYAAADPEPAATDALTNSRLNDYEIERIGGKAAVYATRLNRWLAGLWHGRPLACTVAVLATVVALACLWAAHLAALPIDDEDRSEPKP